MKNISLTGILLVVLAYGAFSQKFITKTGTVRFYSEAPLEKIEAITRQVNSVLDATSGNMAFKVLIKSFTFEKALMQEHFNENYMESDKFPDATFVGKVVNLKDVNFANEGTYNVTIEGKITLHGLTREISEKGTLELREGRLLARCRFMLTLSDFNISIPKTVINNISKTVEVTVDQAMDRFIL
jgi:hypothetical protein